MKSRDLTLVQGRLDLARRAQPNSVPIEMIRKQKTKAQAITLAVSSSGLDDQEICDALVLDPGYFSRMKKGAATLDADYLRPFCDMVGNNIYAEWLAYQTGCTLVMIKSEMEMQLEAERELRMAAENELAILRKNLAVLK